MKSKQGMTEYYAKLYWENGLKILRFSNYRSMERWFYEKVRLQVVRKKSLPLIECYKKIILSTGDFNCLVFMF